MIEPNSRIKPTQNQKISWDMYLLKTALISLPASQSFCQEFFPICGIFILYNNNFSIVHEIHNYMPISVHCTFVQPVIWMVTGCCGWTGEKDFCGVCTFVHRGALQVLQAAPGGASGARQCAGQHHGPPGQWSRKFLVKMSVKMYIIEPLWMILNWVYKFVLLVALNVAYL